MTIITSASNLDSHQLTLFQQGVTLIIQNEDNEVGIWAEHTPHYLEKPTVTIGACKLNPATGATFLKEVISHINSTYPNRPIIGPMNGNTWMKHRLIIESSEQPSFLMEPIEPLSLFSIFQQAGFNELSHYSSSLIDLTQELNQYEKIATRISKHDIHIRNIDLENYQHDLEQIYHLSTSSFSNNFLYTPLPKTAFLQSYLSAKNSIDPDLVTLAFHKDQLIGFLFCLPNQHPNSIIIKTLATSPQFRTTGLGTYLVATAQQRAKEKGYTEAIHALQYQSNASLRISKRFHAKKFRTYALMIAS